MKNYLKIFAALGLMFTTITTMANEPTIDLENGKNGKAILLKLDSQSAETNIRLTDSEGNVLYNENSSGKVFSKKFNLEKLEAGNYNLMVEDQLSKLIYNIIIDEETLLVEKIKEVTNKPLVRLDDEKVYLNFLNSSLTPVKISILDNNGFAVYEETRVNELIVKGIYNLKVAPEGDYTLKVKYGNETFKENIVIK